MLAEDCDDDRTREGFGFSINSLFYEKDPSSAEVREHLTDECTVETMALAKN